MMLIDAHTHLNGEILFPQREQSLKDFEKAWGKILINAGANAFYNQHAIHIAQTAISLFPNLQVKANIGYHPGDVHHIQKEHFDQMIHDLETSYLEHKEHIVAIGETGIDLHYPENATLADQQLMLRLQAKLARKHQLPLIVHSRDGFAETVEVLKEFSDLKLYFHCWGYGPDEVQKAEQLFPQLWLGFTGVITYPRAHATRESLLAVKSAHILMETDAPYLPPQAFRGQTNVPAHVRYVYATCAEVLGMEQEDLEAQVEGNFLGLFWG